MKVQRSHFHIIHLQEAAGDGEAGQAIVVHYHVGFVEDSGGVVV